MFLEISGSLEEKNQPPEQAQIIIDELCAEAACKIIEDRKRRSQK